MTTIPILLDKYWSKSRAFLLPLTGMVKPKEFDVDTYMYWEDYSINDFLLIVKFTYGQNFPEFMEYVRQNIFANGKRANVLESYDADGFSIFVFDISEWAFDVEQFLKGKYSKLSKEAKDVIYDFHLDKKLNTIGWHILAALFPFEKRKELNNKAIIDYVIETYELPAENLRRLGELASIFDRKEETLSLAPENTGQVDGSTTTV